MKKEIGILLLTIVLLLTACSSKVDEEKEVPALKDNQIYVYCVNNDKTDVVTTAYTLKKHETLTDEIEDLIHYVTNLEATVDYKTPVAEGIVYDKIEYEPRQKIVKLYFDISYEGINTEGLLFFKTCISKTILQLDGVESVSIALTDLANNDAETATVTEYFDNNSFTMNFGDKSGYKQSGIITLFYANEEGDALKEYQQTIEISNNTSLAKIVLEALINGPETDGYTATISDDTVINNVSVKEGICYVDLSEEFYDTGNPLKNDIIVYSVVNSLVELPTVSKVQFLKNGEKIQFFRETLPFDSIFERNLDIIEQEESE